MKHLIYSIILATIFFACKPSVAKELQAENSEIDTDSIDYAMLVEAEQIISEELRPVDGPLIGDTIRYQLAGQLYFSDGHTPPKDSITVLETHHSFHEEYGQYLEYKFIVHSKNTPYHTKYTSKELDEAYKAYSIKNENEDYDYSKAYKEFYEQTIAQQKKELGNVSIDKAIDEYTGYWTYLTKLDGQFYIDDEWAWTSSFLLSENLLTKHYMDGPFPYFIEYFEKKDNGDLIVKTTDDDSQILYKLIDPELMMYQSTKREDTYVVPAKNVHHFEIIEYANNTGDLI